MKKRRKQRVVKDYVSLIRAGNVKAFYDSTAWKILREQALERDKHTCQFFLGLWNDGKHFPDKIKIVEAKYGHHIKPIKEYPELALELDNVTSLSFEAHEIVEDRKDLFKKRMKKKQLNLERW